MARLRHALACVFSATLAIVSPALARAQSCHVPQLQDALEQGLRLAIGQETASFRSSRYEGHYEGVTLRSSVTQGRFFASLAMPGYRIVRNGLASRGFGDLLAYSQVSLLPATSPTARGGLALGASAPTGDARVDLGMGHWMLMPGAWLTASTKPILAGAQLTYAKALAGTQGHHHASSGPLVAPMSESEFDATFFAALPIDSSKRSLRLKAGSNLALPVAQQSNAVRADAFVAFTLGDRARASIELHLPLVGEPSTQRLVIELSVAVP